MAPNVHRATRDVTVQIFIPGEGGAMVIGDQSLSDQMAIDWADKPFFVIQDASHARIMVRLQAGEEGVYSYLGTCPHTGPRAPLRCTCTKMLNVLRDGHMARYVNGEARPVLSHTEFMALQNPMPAATGKGKGKGKGFEPFSGTGRRLDDLGLD